MDFEKQHREHQSRLKKMAIAFLSLPFFVISVTYFLPNDESSYWFSKTGKEGFYVLSSFLIFLGIYCLGSINREKQMF